MKRSRCGVRECKLLSKQPIKKRFRCVHYSLLCLPNEILVAVMEYLGFSSSVALLSSCKTLYNAFLKEVSSKMWIYKQKRPYTYFNYITAKYYIESIGLPHEFGFLNFIFRFKHIPPDKYIVVEKTGEKMVMNLCSIYEPNATAYLDEIILAILTEHPKLWDMLIEELTTVRRTNNNLKHILTKKNMRNGKQQKIYTNPFGAMFYGTVLLTANIIEWRSMDQ